MIIAALVACEPTDNIEFSDYTQQESSSTESDIPEVSEDNPGNDNSGNTQPPVVHGEPPKAEPIFPLYQPLLQSKWWNFKGEHSTKQQDWVFLARVER